MGSKSSPSRSFKVTSEKNVLMPRRVSSSYMRRAIVRSRVGLPSASEERKLRNTSKSCSSANLRFMACCSLSITAARFL